MPYIDPATRAKLDPHLARLSKEIADLTGNGPSAAGVLNYCCTKLALQIIQPKYWSVAMVRGVFNDLCDEFYRRFVAPYEDEKIRQNGDVFPTLFPTESEPK